MNVQSPMKYGTLTLTRSINAPRELVFKAWTELDHRKHWFAGPGWSEIKRSVDLRVGGQEIAHGQFENGVETIYTSTFHHILPNERLIYAFDMHVAGEFFSSSLTGVDFITNNAKTELTYTEHCFFLGKEYDIEGRIEGTNWLLDQFTAHMKMLH